MENNVPTYPAHTDEDERSRLLYRKPNTSIQTAGVPLVTKINNTFALHNAQIRSGHTECLSMYLVNYLMPIAVASRSKSWVCGRSLAGVAGSNPAGGEGISLVDFAYCHVQVYSIGRSLVQRNPTECVPLSVIRCNKYFHTSTMSR
jgi:hypothetical protein